MPRAWLSGLSLSWKFLGSKSGPKRAKGGPKRAKPRYVLETERYLLANLLRNAMIVKFEKPTSAFALREIKNSNSWMALIPFPLYRTWLWHSH